VTETCKLLVDGPERVAAGAAKLDAKRPGWAARLLADVNRFDMADCHWCVLGICYGMYRDGLDGLGLADGAGFGFHLSYQDMQLVHAGDRAWDALLVHAGDRGKSWTADLAWGALRDLWLEEARKRTEKESPGA
jgi:hypothetical protein